jgi:TonB family protein
VSSATDSTPPVTAPVNASEINSKRPNPVALETMINVTGARHSVSGDARDLFSEDSTTVLVFRDGAIIRLDAGVAIGQLLFLKHKKTAREVVCQVLHKRNYKPTSCYVELQFTEDKPDFWGVAFPAFKAGSADFKLKEQLEAEETTADDQGSAVAPHSEAEVDKLRKELDDLRQQLKNLEQQRAAEAAHADKPDSARPVVDSTLPQQSQTAAPEAATQNPSSQTQTSTPANPDAAPWIKAPKIAPSLPRPMVGMTLPTQKTPADKPAPDPKDPVEALLPKPALDFSKIPDPKQTTEHTRSSSLSRLDTKRILLLALSLAALVTVAVAWWRHSQVAKAPASSTSAPRQLPAIEKKSVPRNSQPSALASKAVPATAQQKPAISPTSVETHTSTDSKLNAVPPAHDSSSLRANHSSAAIPLAKPRSTSKRNPADASAHATSTSAATTLDSGATDATSIPAKLLKAANPVYPPDAMRNYITGDVRASVVVDATGHVQNIEVLSGPQALRAAAVEALKRYQYAPATLSGAPISSKQVVTVKFWFNP